MIVMKFGGTSLQDAESIRRAVGIVKSHQDRQPLVVVSAIGSTTKALLQLGDIALNDGVDAAHAPLDDIAQRHRDILIDILPAEYVAPVARVSLDAVGVVQYVAPALVSIIDRLIR